MKLPRIPRNARVKLATAATIVGLVGGGLFAVQSAVHLLHHHSTPVPLDANVGDQVSAAAEFALHAQGIDAYTARRYQEETSTRWQVSLLDATGGCWKVEVAFEGHVAKAVGQPATVGCWPLPSVGVGPSTGDAPDRDSDAAARGFLTALLTGGDWHRWAEEGSNFPQPAPLHNADFALLDSNQSGQVVSVNGWVNATDPAGKARRVNTTWRVTLSPGPSGPVASRLDAGPLPPRQEDSPSPTSAPTTSTTYPTTTSTTPSSSPTTRKPQE
jgi:hypothetical protein